MRGRSRAVAEGRGGVRGSPGAQEAASSLAGMHKPDAVEPVQRDGGTLGDLFAAAVPVGDVSSPQKTMGGRVAVWLDGGGGDVAQKHLPDEDGWRVTKNGAGGEVRLTAQITAPPFTFLLVLESDGEVKMASDREESEGRRAIRRSGPLPPFRGLSLLRCGDGVHTAYCSFRSDDARQLKAGDVLQVLHAAHPQARPSL